MKTILLSFTIFSVSISAYAQCTGRVDEKSVMMFMDMNNSSLEIAAAQRAACARGQKLVVLPKNHREYNVLTNTVQNDMKRYERCLGTGGTCERETQAYSQSFYQLQAVKDSLPVAKDQLKAELEAMKASGKKLVNFTISGHDGGGTYSGHKGEISRADMLEVMQQYPEVNGVKSVLLLGCYTTVPNEVIHWKTIFPSGKMIAGYDGIAPASDKLAGHQYLEDLLKKESLILKQADQARLNQFLKTGIRGLPIMNTGVYVELECVGPNKLFYGLDEESRRMRSLDIKECDGKTDLVTKIGADITRYYIGESEPPADTRNGELRRIYNQGRRYEHCGAHLDKEFSMTQAFNLLFYDGLKKSFAHYYKNDLNLAQQIIGTITPEELTSPYLSQIKLLEEEATENKELAKLAETPKKYKEYVEAKLAEANAKKAALAQGIQDLIDGDRLPKNPEETEKLSQYKAADKKGNEYQWLKEDIVEGNETPEDLKSYHSGNAQIANEQLGRLRISMAEITSKPEQFQVWIPNAENLARKTRKETLENIHKMETVSRMPGLAPRKAMALKWLHQINTYHLQTMENPFSWHEYTGRQPERPIGADNLNLESWLKVGGEN